MTPWLWLPAVIIAIIFVVLLILHQSARDFAELEEMGRKGHDHATPAERLARHRKAR